MGFGILDHKACSFVAVTNAPSTQQMTLQIALGGSEKVRDRMANDVQRRQALKAVGARVTTKSLLDRIGVTKPAAAKRS